MSRVEAEDGIGLYTEVHGAGVPILITGGLCTTHENWRPQVDPLVDAGAKVMLWDLRGHGLSESPGDPSAYTFERVVDDMARVLDQLAPAESPVLMGHSFGGLTSLHYAHRRAAAGEGSIRGLVLMSAGPGFKNPKAQAGWQAQCDRTAGFLEERGCRAFVEGRAGDTCVGKQRELPMARAAAEAIAAQDPKGLASFSRRIAGQVPSAIELLPELTCPALVIVGSEDEPYRRAAEVMAAKLPVAEAVVLEGAGHVANLDAAEAFNEVVTSFVKRL